MAVQSVEYKVFPVFNFKHRFCRLVTYYDAEFTVRLCRLNSSVRVSLNQRIDSEQHLLGFALLLAYQVKPFNLVKAVQNNMPYAGSHSFGEFFGSLVVAVHYDMFGVNSRLLSGVKLSSRHDVRPKPLAFNYFIHSNTA